MCIIPHKPSWWGKKNQTFLLHHEVYNFSLLHQLQDHIRKAVKNGFAILSKFFIWKSTPITLCHLQVKLPGNAGDCICIVYPLWRFFKGLGVYGFAVSSHRHLAGGSDRIACVSVAVCVVEKSQRKVCMWWWLAAGQHSHFATYWLIGCGPLMDYRFPSLPLILPSQYSSIMHGTNYLLHCKDCKAKTTLYFNLNLFVWRWIKFKEKEQITLMHWYMFQMRKTVANDTYFPEFNYDYFS